MITLLQELVHSGSLDIICIIGSGVLIAVKADLHATRRSFLERNESEPVVVELNNVSSKSVNLYTFYCPPDSNPDVFQELNSSIQDTSKPDGIFLVGDFHLDVAHDCVTFAEQMLTLTRGQLEKIYSDLFDDSYLKQFILRPTHNEGNKLAFLLCNCPKNT